MRPASRSLLLPSLLVALVATVALAIGTATPAGAHAVVVSSNPAADERLPTAPTEVSVVFSEAVTSDLGGITVLDSAGDRVDNDDSAQPNATTLRATLEPDLGDGTYVANYKVVSADGHPISGAIVFGVGNAQLGDVSGLAATNDTTTERIGMFARFLAYAAALLAAGLAFFLVFVHDGGADRRSMARLVQISTIVAAIGAVLTIAAQASLATGEGLGAIAQLDTLRGVLREGMGWSTAVLFVGLALCHLAVTTRPSTLAQGLTFYGSLAVTTSFVFWGHAIEAPNMWLAIAADVTHVAVAATWFGGLVGLTMTLSARTRAARAAGLAEPTLVTDAVPAAPLAGAAAGGDDDPSATAGATAASGRSTTALLDRPDGDHGDGGAPVAGGAGSATAPGSLAATVTIVRRFSTLAAVSVIVLTISGVALGWQEVGSIDALLSTTYGQTLLVKLAIVAVILALAAYNRFLLLPWLLDDDSAHAAPPSDAPPTTTEAAPVSSIAASETDMTTTTEVAPAGRTEIEDGLEAGWRTLLRTVATEALAIVAVLAVTAVLVNIIPGRADTVATGPFSESQPFREGTVSLTVTPNRPGVNSVHVDFLGAVGRPADLAQKVILELRLPEKGIGPLEREMVKGGVGHFILEGISDLSIAGTWEITLNVRVSDFDQERITFTDPIG